MRIRLIMLPLIALAVTAIGLVAGSDGGARVALADDCTRRAMPDNLQSLIDGAVSGDVVCMAPGVYRGPVMFQSKSGITLRGAGVHVSIVAGGDRDSMLVFDSENLTFENFTLFYGHPSDAYISHSRGVTFRNMDVGGGGIGIHFDNGSIGVVSDSFVYAMEGDGVLVRHDSNVSIHPNWVFANGGVGVSYVNTSLGLINGNEIADNRGSAICAFKAGEVRTPANNIHGNAVDEVGICHETTP